MKRKVVVGIYSPGTTGSRIIHAVLHTKDLLGVDEVIVFKRTPDKEYCSVLEMMRMQGARFAFQKDMIKKFSELGIGADYEREDALGRVDVLVDCSAEGVPLQHKPDYERLATQCRGFICQGAEEDKGFSDKDTLLVYGVNMEAFNFEKDRWIQVGSCNTHAGSFLLRAIAYPYDPDSGEIMDTGLLDAQFHFIRRSLDLNQKSKAVISTEVSRHSSPLYGTHHAEDIASVFRSKGIELEGKIISSAVKINEPYFHTVHFAFSFDRAVTKEEVTRRLEAEHRILFSTRKLVHYAFQFGTSYGFMGRFSNPAIVVDYDVFRLSGNRWQVRGHAFTPQDGNFLLSNLAALVGYLSRPEGFRMKMSALETIFLGPVRKI
ncbi:MAG: hypothetical protein HY456_01880 [Parcubacteria group bacterium]|nr:hypothetical protein [Parcubacteria group bacterium]